MKHDPVIRMIGELFALPRDAGGKLTPRDVAARAAKKLSRWPLVRARALKIAGVKKDPGMSEIEGLALALRNQMRLAKERSQADTNLMEALLYGAISKRPKGEGSAHLTCRFCWRPGSPAKVNGKRTVVCAEHHAHEPEGRRLIRIAEKAGGIDNLLDEVLAARSAVRSDYAALAAARKRYEGDTQWKVVHNKHKLGKDKWEYQKDEVTKTVLPEYVDVDNGLDDQIAICAAAWDQILKRYSRILRMRDTAGRPRAWSDDQIAEAAKECGSLRDLAKKSGISPATLSRRLREMAKSQPSQT